MENIAEISLGKNGLLSLENINRIHSAVKEAEEDENIRLTIIYGEGRFFSVGADLKHVAEAETPDYSAKLFSRLADLFRLLLSTRKPVILAVNGDAYGGGAELLWVGDVVVAYRGAKFYWVEARWGLVPPILTVLGPYILGPARARFLAMTGEPLDAEEAYRLGLVSVLVDDPGSVLDRARGVARMIMENSPNAVYAVKNIYKSAVVSGLLELGISELIRLSMTEEVKRASRSFVEKRKPVYEW